LAFASKTSGVGFGLNHGVLEHIPADKPDAKEFSLASFRNKGQRLLPKSV